MAKPISHSVDSHSVVQNRHRSPISHSPLSHSINRHSLVQNRRYITISHSTLNFIPFSHSSQPAVQPAKGFTSLFNNWQYRPYISVLPRHMSRQQLPNSSGIDPLSHGLLWMTWNPPCQYANNGAGRGIHMGRSPKLLQSINREENNLLSAVFLLLLTSSARLCLYRIKEKKMGNVVCWGKFC